MTEEMMLLLSISGPMLHSFGQRLEKNYGEVKEPSLGYSQPEMKHYSHAPFYTTQNIPFPIKQKGTNRRMTLNPTFDPWQVVTP